MSRVIFVNTKPSALEEGEYLIPQPNFLEEIALHRTKAPRNNLTGNYHLRMIADSIAAKYDPENMTAYSVKAHLYEGRSFSSDEELNDIVVSMIESCYPKVLVKYLEHKILNRPVDAKKIIIVRSDLIPDELAASICIRNGLALGEDKSEETSVAVSKPKKVVGKPALTKEQVELLKAQQD